MMTLFYILAVFVFALNAVFIFLIIRASVFKFTQNVEHLERYPTVTFLVAARNEQQNIQQCIQSILNQNYPKEKVQIIIGDDNSEDDTYKLASSFEGVEVVEINSKIADLEGKSNVLAQIAHRAKGEYLAFTDADIQLPKSWLLKMISEFEENTGIVSGATKVEVHAMQNIDWLVALAMVKSVSDFGVPVTAIGNNMVIRKTVYDEIGGFEGVGKSIVEDYAIFKKITEKYAFKNLYETQTLATTKPINGFLNLMMQRKRWFQGAIKLPLPILSILVLKSAVFPIIIALMCIDFKSGLVLWVLKLFFQSLYTAQLFIKLQQKVSFLSLIIYEIYDAIVSFFLLIFSILPFKIRWKGRVY